MPGERILVVDDSPLNLRLTQLIFEKAGYAVQTAVDGADALKVIKDFGPHLVLMDIQLPGIDGLEVTRQLRTDPANNSLIVLALTAYSMKGDERRALDAGCDGYIAKPIDTQTLTATIRNYLDKKRTVPQTDPAEGVVDVPDFMERALWDQALVQELVRIFSAESPRLLARIKEAVTANDPTSLSKAAGAIKGSVANFSAIEAVRAAAALEKMGLDSNMSYAKAGLAKLENEIERLTAVLLKISKEGPGVERTR
jgi:CheY-like chemotaxis protein